jgi:hypothetical protein
MTSASVAIAPQAETTAAPQVKHRRIPKKIRHAVELLISGECKTQKAAAERVKLSREHLSKSLRLPHVLAHIESRTRIALAQSQAQASATLLRLLDEAGSEHVQKDVAIHLLGINGHKPKADAQVSVNIELKAGYVIDLSERAPGGGEAFKTIDHEQVPARSTAYDDGGSHGS